MPEVLDARKDGLSKKKRGSASTPVLKVALAAGESHVVTPGKETNSLPWIAVATKRTGELKLKSLVTATSDDLGKGKVGKLDEL